VNLRKIQQININTDNKKNKITPMNLRPYGDRIIVETATETTLAGGVRVDAQGKTGGGLFVPQSVDKEEPQIAKIVALGQGRKVKGTLTANEFGDWNLMIGDQVIINKYTGAKIEIDGKPYKVITSDDVLVVIENEKASKK
jgi:chaperonin GroES